MKGLITRIALTSVVTFLAGAAFITPSRSAAGNFLYWGTTEVKTGSLRTCYDFANDAMRLQGFQNIRRSGIEVAGSRGGAYAAITCIGTAPRATAVVMAVGSDQAQTISTRDILRSKIAGMIRFD